ncbi:MAG: efflux RND transporter periplasmic adaptor subunit [Planctomycetes bacterium]|nr:efflux RND transporter periplasmic adaptor subunit [Planctomycetota bacterium]
MADKEHLDPTADFDDEGGLRAPPGLTGWRKAWWWFDFIILVKLARLRFIAVLAAIGIVITQWELLSAHYDKWTRPALTAEGVGGDVEWFCPMHPSVVRDNSKEKCPICFMPLSKRKKGETNEEALPAGIVNRVQLSPYRVVLAGIHTIRVDYQALSKEITAVGYVEFNEREVKNVSARVKGRIDTLNVNETGQMVDKGEVLASLYSPELNVTMQNLVDAQKRGNRELVESGRHKLDLLGISDDQIDEVLKAGKGNSHLKIRSPMAGHVIKKYVREGQYVDEGTPLYDLADLSTVWIQSQIYEDDLAFLPAEQAHKPGPEKFDNPLQVTATTRAYPDEEFQGLLTFIYPHVDQQTRTVTVRFELKNPGHRLRPGTTANVRIKVRPREIRALVQALQTNPEVYKVDELDQGLVAAVPEASVIDTGSQTIVYRQTLPGVYEGVRVDLGPRMSGPDDVPYFPVLRGLVPGEIVVTAGSFLVDAETRLNPAAGSIYFGGSSGSKSDSGGSTVRPTTPEDTDAKINQALARLSDKDRKVAEQQQFCPIIADSRLGSMGVPIKLVIDDEPVFVCCDGCKKAAQENGKETLAKVKKRKSGRPGSSGGTSPAASPQQPTHPARETGPDAKIQAALANLPAADQALAVKQRFCVVLPKSRLGSMGPPVKMMVAGQPVFLCCEACEEEALADPAATLKKVEKLKQLSPSQSKD